MIKRAYYPVHPATGLHCDDTRKVWLADTDGRIARYTSRRNAQIGRDGDLVSMSWTDIEGEGYEIIA